VTSELHFQECRIPEANRLPRAEGLKAALACLNQARAGIAWGALGAAMACYSEALEYAKSRIQFGKPIASFQLVQEKLVGMLSDITQGQLLAHRLASLKDEDKARPEMVSLAKRNNVAMALRTARSAREILAANGITDEYCVGRHMANLESVYTYEGTHDIHTLIIGQDITGIAAKKVMDSGALVSDDIIIGLVQERLKEAAARSSCRISNVRGRGLLCAFDSTSAEERDALIRRAREKKFLILPCGEQSIRLRPALTVGPEEVEEAANRLTDALG